MFTKTWEEERLILTNNCRNVFALGHSQNDPFSRFFDLIFFLFRNLQFCIFQKNRARNQRRIPAKLKGSKFDKYIRFLIFLLSWEPKKRFWVIENWKYRKILVHAFFVAPAWFPLSSVEKIRERKTIGKNMGNETLRAMVGRVIPLGIGTKTAANKLSAPFPWAFGVTMIRGYFFAAIVKFVLELLCRKLIAAVINYQSHDEKRFEMTIKNDKLRSPLDRLVLYQSSSLINWLIFF